MSQELLREYLMRVRARYEKSSVREKTGILTEFCLSFGYSRKHAIRLINAQDASRSRKRGPEPTYGPDLIRPLKALWFAMGQVCSKRMKAAMPNWLPHYRKRNPWLTDEQAVKLLRMSPATIDRLLAPVRAKRGLSATRAPTGQWYKSVIPIQAKDWNITKPGHLQGDTVAHCGDRLEGMFANTLTATDIFSAWTENRATWGKGAAAILDALKDIEKSLPFSIESFKFDSGSEFMNYGVITHLRSTVTRPKAIEVLRSRPYKKDDNCYVEQKNLTHVRQLLGYERFGRAELVALINEIYMQYWNPLQNFFLPAIKLVRKTRIGSRLKKTYDEPKTPYQRLLDSADVSDESKANLRARYEALDPLALSEGLEKKLKEFFQELRREKLKIAA